MDTITLLSNLLASRPVHAQFLKEMINTVRFGNLPLVRRIFL